jgi:transketolase
MHLGNLAEKFEAFGWQVVHLEEGNNITAVLAAIDIAKSYIGKEKPIVILMKTAMGKGVSFMEGTHEWHGIAPNDAQLAQALSELPETLGDY